MSRRTLEIQSLVEFDSHLASARTLDGWFVQSVDLTGRSAALGRVDPRGAVFLGCELHPGTERNLRSRGALIFPQLPDLPFDPYRPRLYDADDLYGPADPAVPYPESPDALIYAWTKRAEHERTVGDTLATSLHDHAVTDALDEAVADAAPAALVGVMGGHALRRDEEPYRAAARLGRRLARAGRVVVTGGGPGAMEAANLGAYLAPADDDALTSALTLLAEVPSFAPSVDAWVRSARAVRARWPVGWADRGSAGASVGIPTWFYGHEPPNAFGTWIAKYFHNALREDALLARCRGGILYLTGAAGTVQEIFQTATENYYAADDAEVAPMILVGVRYWTNQVPAWPLLQTLAAGRAMARAVHLVDSVDEAADLLLS